MEQFRLSFKILFLLVLLILFCNAAGYAEETFYLSLEQTTRLALVNNFDIQLAKYDAYIARTKENESKSIFDAILSGEVQYNKDQSERTSTIFGSETIDNDYNIGISKKIPTGTTVSMDMTNNRSASNSAFATSPVTHESTLGLKIKQELGRNFFGLQDRGQVKLALKDVESAEYTSLSRIEEDIANVQKAYWDLVLQRERVLIEKDMVALAKELFDLHQEKKQDGLMEAPEVLASEANYRARLNDLKLAQNEVQARVNKIKLFLNISNDTVMIEPTEFFFLPEMGLKLSDSLHRAFQFRRDYKNAMVNVESKNIDLSLKKNDLWPEINITATFVQNGLGDDFPDAVTAITSGEDTPNFTALFEFSMPLENRAAKSRLKASELMKAKAIIELKQVERRLSIEIVDQIRDCEVYKETAESKDDVARLQEMKLSEEKKRYMTGRSDTDTLIRFQEDVSRAKWDAAQAKHRYQTALVDLSLKEGVILQPYWPPFKSE